MTNGLALNESYQFKRMIHGIHGNSKRTYPVHPRQHGGQGAFDDTAADAQALPGRPEVTIGGARPR